MKNNRLLLIVACVLAVPTFWALYKARSGYTLDPLATSMDVAGAEVLVQGPEDKNPVSVAAPSAEEDFDVVKKRKAVVSLVDRAIAFVEQNSFDKALNIFTNGKDFIDAELYLFVYTMKGICLAHGQQPNLVWRDLIDLKDQYGTMIIQDFIKTAEQGGGWTAYHWRNAAKISYIKPFKKDGVSYLIGTGYYPHSKPDEVMTLVKGAVSYFNQEIDEHGASPVEIFSIMSYPLGRFVSGSLYLYALDFEGNMMANGDNPGLIGSNVLDYQDSDGKFANKDIIKALESTTDEGVWIEYKSKNAPKRAYAEKIVDKKGKKYFIACGYYPTADRQATLELVKRGYEFMKRHGISAAVNEFSNRKKDNFRFGDLFLVVYDMQGKCIAHGTNPSYIGMNKIDLKDEDGRLYVQEIIAKAKEGNGWVDIKMKNALESVYVERIELGIDNFVITCGLYPVSKRETAILLARSAASYLRGHDEYNAFARFGNPDKNFMRGDLSVFVIDFNGISRIYGDNYNLIWRNIMDAKDDNGKEYVKLFINTAKQGPGRVTYTINGAKRVAFVESIEKDGTSYVVGSGYFL